jgi:glycosyltransferase involved in cell wall biosynthesis
MYRNHRVTVVVPAYNEQAHILDVIETTPAFVDHIIVVDDCSTDRTYEVVSGAGDARTTLLSTGTNQGVGGATMIGYRKALDQGCDIAVKMDGDGQMAPECLGPLLDALIDGGYDYAKGNRFLVPESLPLMPKHRIFGNFVLTFMTKLASGYWHIFDYQNGFTAIRETALRRVQLAEVHHRFFFENDMLIQLSMQRARVVDVAMPARYGSEVSALNPFRILTTFPLLLFKRFLKRIWHNYVIVDFSPVALFLILGTLLFGWGVVFGAVVWAHSLITDSYASTGTVMLSVLPIVLGFQLLLQAIVLDIQEAPK